MIRIVNYSEFEYYFIEATTEMTTEVTSEVRTEQTSVPITDFTSGMSYCFRSDSVTKSQKQTRN